MGGAPFCRAGAEPILYDRPPTDSAKEPFFFQPLDLHLEPADLLGKLDLDRLARVVVVAAAVAEQRFDAVPELLVPFADRDGVDLERS